MERKSKEKELIKEVVLSNKFTPKTNRNKKTKSIIKKIWDKEYENESLSMESSILKQSRDLQSVSMK